MKKQSFFFKHFKNSNIKVFINYIQNVPDKMRSCSKIDGGDIYLVTAYI